MSDHSGFRPRPERSAPANVTDYGAAAAGFRLEVPDRFNPVLDIVEAWAREDPDAPAVLSLDAAGEVTACQTVAGLAADSRRAARAMLAAGIGKGDHVFVMLPRIRQWHAALLGAMRIGAIPMPGPNLLTPKDITDRLTRARAVAAITDPAGVLKVDQTGVALRARWCVGGETGSAGSGRPGGGGAEVPGGGAGGSPSTEWADFDVALEAAGDGPTPEDPTAREDPLLLYFTSGTVALAKMVQHAQDYALGHVGTARFWQDLRPGDRHWTVTDTGWAKAAWGALFGQFHERACVVQVQLGKPNADTILSILARHQITSFCAPPTLYRLLVQADLRAHDLSALRHCTSAGEPLNPEVIRAWKAGTDLTIYDGYGQTETTCIVANYRGMPVRPGSMGRPVPGWTVDVVDDAGGPVEAGAVGNVVVVVPDGGRQVGLFPGYFENPEATAAVFRGPHYFTGDKAARDEDGYFWFEGRNDDVITSSAYRIGPFEVESALVAHPAVMEAAVIGRPDAERTEIVVGVCILAPGHAPSPALAAELQEFVKTQTAPYKYPREVHFVDALPKTISGKIRRGELRGWLADGRLPRPGAGG